MCRCGPVTPPATHQPPCRRVTPRGRVQGGAGKARSSSDKKELERLLRHGAYDLFNKDAEQVPPLLSCN